MKTRFQVLAFLNRHTPASELDRDMIAAFVGKRYRITPKTRIFALQSPFSPLGVQSFVQWYESGSAASQIAKNDRSLVILGNCNLNTCEIIGVLEGDRIIPTALSAPQSSITPATDPETRTFLHALLFSSLQFNPLTMKLEKKYIPLPNDKVRFYPLGFSAYGVGIVRSVDVRTGEVEFYCHYTYPTKSSPSSLGFSMRENGIANLESFVFEPLLTSSSESFCGEDGISSYRRFKKELEKSGKIWKDKIHRIEPLQMKVPEGSSYWYISDKLEISSSTERLTPVSQKRYLAGNYFPTPEAAEVILRKLRESVRAFLASPFWPADKDG